jgi:hypothetical protein
MEYGRAEKGSEGERQEDPKVIFWSRLVGICCLLWWCYYSCHYHHCYYYSVVINLDEDS